MHFGNINIYFTNIVSISVVCLKSHWSYKTCQISTLLVFQRKQLGFNKLLNMLHATVSLRSFKTFQF